MIFHDLPGGLSLKFIQGIFLNLVLCYCVERLRFTEITRILESVAHTLKGRRVITENFGVACFSKGTLQTSLRSLNALKFLFTSLLLAVKMQQEMKVCCLS